MAAFSRAFRKMISRRALFSATVLASALALVRPTAMAQGLHQGLFQQMGQTYYVDSNTGSDSNSCAMARSPTTPRRTVNGIMACNPGAGDIVKFRGLFTQTISPNQSGQVLYPFQPIQSVSGSTVTFNQSVSGLNPATDYVTIYNSRKGNSGAFAVVSFSGDSVTVDTTSLPLGSFISETAADPGDLHAAILRPVHFTAWDKNNPPVFDTQYQTFYSNCQSAVMLSYTYSQSGATYQVWPALEFDCSQGTPSDYLILDHNEVVNAATAVAVEFRDFQSNYNIIQYNNFHDTGYQGGASDEVIYYGNAYQIERHHDYPQIMYNKIGPHRFTTGVSGDGIEVKPSVHYPTIFGNEITGLVHNGCDDAPIKSDSVGSFIANNYLHDISPAERLGCGISLIDDFPGDPRGGASGSIVMNNIIANVKRVGIRVLDSDNVKVLNNVVYNIFPEPGCTGDCLADSMGIIVQNWKGSTENLEIKNNIVVQTPYGIGRYEWSQPYPVSISSDYNIVYDTTLEPFHGIPQNTNDLVLDPMFVNALAGDYRLQPTSPGIDAGATIPDVAMDFELTLRPQSAGYDIGAYEYGGSPQPTPTATSTSTTLPTSTPTASSTSTPTFTSTSTSTPTASPTSTSTATSTSTPTVGPTSTPTATPTSTSTVVPTMTATPTPNPNEVILDDADAGFSTSFGQDSWEEYIEAGGRHYGGSHHYNRQVGTGQDIAMWSFAVPKPGRYEVYAWWWEASWRPTDVPYTIKHLSGSTTVRVNQQANGGQWNLLGTFDCQGQGSVVVSDDASSGQDIVADAVRLVYLEPLPPASPTSTPTASPTSTPTIVPTMTATPTANPDEVVIDNMDGGFSASFSQDAWVEYIQSGGRHYGGSHYYNRRIGTGEDIAVWSFTVPKPGRYKVYAWWWEGRWRPKDVPYTINYLDGSTTVRVNQRIKGGRWNLLGAFDFLDQGSVAVSDDASSGYDVVADAVRVVYQRPLRPGGG